MWEFGLPPHSNGDMTVYGGPYQSVNDSPHTNVVHNSHLIEKNGPMAIRISKFLISIARLRKGALAQSTRVPWPSLQ